MCKIEGIHYLRETGMPIRHAVIHSIDKKPDGNPAILHLRDTELPLTDVLENLLSDFNDAYNGKQSKGWGLFHAESGAAEEAMGQTWTGLDTGYDQSA